MADVRGQTSAHDDPEHPLDERRSSLGLLLAVLGHHAMRRLRETHTRHNLSPRQYQLLALLHEQGSTGQRELGQTMETDPSMLVTLLNALEADALVSRTRDPVDRRRHLVALTARGKCRLAIAARAQCEVEDSLFGGLDGEQREQLRRLLLALQQSLVGGCAEVAEGGCSSLAADDQCSRRQDSGEGGGCR
ncbi:MAG: MarR family transcriptional regulator [Solirubrobacteraceae bacterium]|jgi:DNA-binding MarR family transcriptional regulator